MHHGQRPTRTDANDLCTSNGIEHQEHNVNFADVTAYLVFRQNVPVDCSPGR